MPKLPARSMPTAPKQAVVVNAAIWLLAWVAMGMGRGGSYGCSLVHPVDGKCWSSRRPSCLLPVFVLVEEGRGSEGGGRRAYGHADGG